MWNDYNGTYHSQLKIMLNKELPESKIKADPHIESRIKLLKRQYNVICEMITIGSGFRWNDEEKCMIASKDVFDGWVRVSPKCSSST